jgi:hypothetical protein
MKAANYFLAGAILTLLPSVALGAQASTPYAGESLEKFAARITGADQEGIKITKAGWNGRPFVFVEYTASKPIKGGDSEEDRILVALQRISDGSYRKIDVTVGEEEGGTAQVEAIAFANADKDPAKELVVLLSWPVKHYDVQGTYYEVRLFDDLRSNSAEKLIYLKTLSEHFNKTGCECARRDGAGWKMEHYKFKTAAAIKQELKRMGY